MKHLTYSKVVSTLALVFAVGTGGAYAATTISKNAVGSKQLRKNAVTGSKVRDGSLGVGDLSSRARTKLRGSAGPQGPAGPAAVTYRTTVDDTCRPSNGNASDASIQGGACTVTFPADVSACTYSATLANVPGSIAKDPGPGTTSVAPAGGGAVTVRTYDAAGSPVGKGFHLLVAC